MKECGNCGFRFEQGEVIPTKGVRHPQFYYNPQGVLPWTPYTTEVCPKCGSDAIKEMKK